MSMKLKSDSGISLTTVIITIVVVIVLAAVATTYSSEVIDNSDEAQREATIYQDKEIIRVLMTNTITDKDARVGYELLDGAVVVIAENGKEYGTGYHLVPGGYSDGDLGEIRDKFGDDTITAYRGLSAPYVVDYYTGKYERVENIEFR